MFVPVFRMIVCSDIHYKENDDTEKERFEKGMELAYKYADGCEYSGVDAFVAVGDFANRGSRGEMLKFAASLKKCIRPETDITLTLASHEFMTDGEQNALERFNEIFNQSPDVHKKIKGFDLIAISTEQGCRIKEAKQQWLKNELIKAAGDNRKKPIFVFQHPHLSNTVYGSINWGEDDIISILMNYPQVIDFSGHSHAPINDPRSVYQKYFTSFGTGSFSYFELDEFNYIYGTVPPDAHTCAQFLIVEANENGSVRVLPYDVLSQGFFNEGSFIKEPWNPDSFCYTDKRFLRATAPYFLPGVSPEVTVNNNQIDISFGAAVSNNEAVNSYTVTIRRSSDKTVIKQIEISSSYYIVPMPKSYSISTEIAEKGEFTVEVAANGFWHNSSDKIIKEFIVK